MSQSKWKAARRARRMMEQANDEERDSIFAEYMTFDKHQKRVEFVAKYGRRPVYFQKRLDAKVKTFSRLRRGVLHQVIRTLPPRWTAAT